MLYRYARRAAAVRTRKPCKKPTIPALHVLGNSLSSLSAARLTCRLRARPVLVPGCRSLYGYLQGLRLTGRARPGAARGHAASAPLHAAAATRSNPRAAAGRGGPALATPPRRHRHPARVRGPVRRAAVVQRLAPAGAALGAARGADDAAGAHLPDVRRHARHSAARRAGLPLCARPHPMATPPTPLFGPC